VGVGADTGAVVDGAGVDIPYNDDDGYVDDKGGRDGVAVGIDIDDVDDDEW
jgi:hypothetical protein